MMNLDSRISVFSVLCVVILCSGCAGGGSQNKPSLLAGVTALEVTVHAESKTGWQDPRKQSDYMGDLRPGEDRAFQTIDYGQLDEIVIWVEPMGPLGSSGIVSTAGNISINLRSPQSSLMVAGRGSIWDFRNATGKVEQVYLRTEAGRVVNLGAIAGPGQSFDPDVQGLVEVMIVGRDQPVARVFVAPSAFVRVASAGKPVMMVALPPGPAKVVVWHARLPGSSTNVNLETGQTTRASLTIGVNSLPKVP